MIRRRFYLADPNEVRSRKENEMSEMRSTQTTDSLMSMDGWMEQDEKQYVRLKSENMPQELLEGGLQEQEGEGFAHKQARAWPSWGETAFFSPPLSSSLSSPLLSSSSSVSASVSSSSALLETRKLQERMMSVAMTA